MQKILSYGGIEHLKFMKALGQISQERKGSEKVCFL